MKKKLVLVLAMVLSSVMLFAACGGAPSYVTNPPEDPKDLVTKLEDDDFIIMSSGSEGVYAMKMTPELDMEDPLALLAKLATMDEKDKITIEVVAVMYAPDEATAKEAFEESEKDFNDELEELKGKLTKMKATGKMSQKGKTVSTYMKVSGTVKDYITDAENLGDLI